MASSEVAMVAKKTRRLAKIFEFCVRMELAVESPTKMVGIWLEDLSISAMELG